MARLSLAIALAACVSLLATPAAAQDKKPRIGVHIEGSSADKYREMIVGIVPEGIEVVPTSAPVTPCRKSGLTGGQMGKAITSQTMRATGIRIVQTSVTRDELAGAIVGRVRSGRTGDELVVLFVDKSDKLA